MSTRHNQWGAKPSQEFVAGVARSVKDRSGPRMAEMVLSSFSLNFNTCKKQLIHTLQGSTTGPTYPNTDLCTQCLKMRTTKSSQCHHQAFLLLISILTATEAGLLGAGQHHNHNYHNHHHNHNPRGWSASYS